MVCLDLKQEITSPGEKNQQQQQWQQQQSGVEKEVEEIKRDMGEEVENDVKEKMKRPKEIEKEKKHMKNQNTAEEGGGE